MPGLKALSDLTEGPQQSRAVAAHAAAVGVSGALSFGIAGAVNAWLGWQWALVPGALGAALAFVLVLVGLPARPLRAAPGPRGALLDFRPILRNRSALAYSVAYCVHTWEMSALRGWVVAFLTFVAAQTSSAWTPLAPATVASVNGPRRRVGERLGQRAVHSIRPPPFHPRDDAHLRGVCGGDRFQCSAAVRRRGRTRAAVRDADLVGLVVPDSGQWRQRRAWPAWCDAGRPLNAWLRRRLCRPAGARGDARSPRRRERAGMGVGIRPRHRRPAPRSAGVRVVAPGRSRRRSFDVGCHSLCATLE